MPHTEQHVKETGRAHLSSFILTPTLLQLCCCRRVLRAEGLPGHAFPGVIGLDTGQKQGSWLVTSSAAQGQEVCSVLMPLLHCLRLGDVLLPAGRRHETLAARAAQGRYGKWRLLNDVLKILYETAAAEPSFTASINTELASTSNAFRVLKTDHAGG